MALQSTRRPFTGSCHCGNTRYIVYLRLPHEPPQDRTSGRQQEIYRCNCRICHKIGFLHMRLASSPDDFLLLSPSSNPYAEIGDYTCDSGALHFLYCKKCAVRCFIFMGEGETVKANLDEIGVGGSGTVDAWRPKKDGWEEGKTRHGCYLSVNACTLDQEQDGLDMREWTEKKWVAYLQILKDGAGEQPRYERPHEGGMY